MITERVSHEDILLFEILRNPCLAPEFIYNIDLDPENDPIFEFTLYQKEVMSDFNSFVSLCQARATGKCLHKDSMILNPDNGEYRTVEDWFIRQDLDKILSLDDKLKQRKSTLFIEPNGVVDCLKINTAGGYETVVTKDHPLLTNTGFVEARKLKVGDFIAVAKEIPYFGNNVELNDLEIKIVAHFIAEGTYHSGSITTTSREVIKDIYDYSSSIGYRVSIYDKITYSITQGTHKNIYLQLLSSLGLRNKHSYDKYIPQEIFRLPKEKVGLFLNSLFGDDGWCIPERTHAEVGYASTSKRLVYDIKHLLLRFGIQSSVIFKKNKCLGAWNLSIKGLESFTKFKESIGFTIDYKKENLDKCVIVSKDFQNQADVIPISNFHDYQYYRYDSTYDRMSITRLGYYPSRIKAERVINKDAGLEQMLYGDACWVKITNIEEVPEQETYAVEAFSNSTHLVDNIWSHNTVSLVSLFIWLLIFRVFPDDYLLYTVPSKVHLEPVFTGLIRKFRSNSFLKQFIESKGGINSSDYKISLLNTSTLLCRIAGQSGGGANLIGLHTPFIEVDESSYYPYGAFNEMQPALNTFTPGFREIVAGVPNGMREKNVLWMADQENNNYTKHRVSALDNPRITKEDYERALEQYGGEDTEDMQHLFYGRHGRPVYSLFDRGMFDIEPYPIYKLDMDGTKTDNLSDYFRKLSIIPGLPEKANQIIMGIDLGFTEPTAIWIMYQDKMDRLRFHAKIKLTKVSYPIQEKIIDFIDTKFECNLIGMDEGQAGKTTRQHFFEDNAYVKKNYRDRLIPIDFASMTVTGIDQDGVEIKSRTKPLMVSILQEYSSTHRLVYSSTDQEMITELERMTYTKNAITGDISYRTLTMRGGTRGEDHFTSALLCACGAYYLTNEFYQNVPQKKILMSARWV